MPFCVNCYNSEIGLCVCVLLLKYLNGQTDKQTERKKDR